MLGQLFAIARNTFIESIRQPIFFVLVLSSGILQFFNTLLSYYSMGYTEQELEVSADNKLLLDNGLATVMLCATLLAAFVATAVLAREVENKTALTVISKPVGRPLFVLGKYLGVSSAILWAASIMTLFLLFAIRHQVMSTVRDPVDMPVLVFSGLAVLFSIALGIWGNYFYGWVFSSTCVFTLLPASFFAYVLTLMLSKEWAWQSIATDLKPQVLLAAACVLLALMVITAVAIVASTRLGQVMTITVAAGVLIMGLLSNHLIGRHAFKNQSMGIIEAVSLDDPADGLREAGSVAEILLKQPAREELRPGAPLYFADNPTGTSMPLPAYGPFEGDPSDAGDVRDPENGPALVISEVANSRNFKVVNVSGLSVGRPPQPGDSIFYAPTTIHWGYRLAWCLVPNMQFFWMVDAITQGNEITARYVVTLALYGGVQIVALLAIAIMLFQRRDLG